VARSGPECLPSPGATLLTASPYDVLPTLPFGVPAPHPAPPQLLHLGTPMTTLSPLAGGWDNASLTTALSTMAMTPPSSDWVIDSGAYYHTTPTSGMLSCSHPPHSSHPTSIVVENGSTLPITSVGASVLPGPFYLNDVLVAPTSLIISFLFVSSLLTTPVPLSLTPQVSL
jgi:hypothetical protein